MGNTNKNDQSNKNYTKQESSSSSHSTNNNNTSQSMLNTNKNQDIHKKIDRQPGEGIYRNSRFITTSNIIVGCPVTLRVKSNETFHGIFITFSPEFDVLLECCHKVDPQKEVIIYGRSLPKKTEVRARFFERESIVEMVAYDVDKDFALKSINLNS